jgi:uncharacterized membrane protein
MYPVAPVARMTGRPAPGRHRNLQAGLVRSETLTPENISMSWSLFDGLRSYVRSSLWVVPFIAIPFALIMTRLAHWFDARLAWPLLTFALPGAQALLQTIVTATLSFVVFTFGSLLVAIQVAGAQLTSRIIATTLLRNDVVKYTVGLFIFTLMFALGAQNRMEKDVHQLVMLLAALLVILSFAAFFYLIDYASRLLRPITILAMSAPTGSPSSRASIPISVTARTDRQPAPLRLVLPIVSFRMREHRASFWLSM